MSVIILLIFFSMLIAGGFLAAFIWAVKNGQFDDKYTPSVRILFDNRKKYEIKETQKKINEHKNKFSFSKSLNKSN